MSSTGAGTPLAGIAPTGERLEGPTYAGRIALLPTGFFALLAVLIRPEWEFALVSRLFGLLLAFVLIGLGVVSLVKPQRIVDLVGLLASAGVVAGLAMQYNIGAGETIFAVLGWLAGAAALVLLSLQFIPGSTVPGRTINTAAFTSPIAPQPAGPGGASAPPALADGWYPDPADGSIVRYWASGAWTEHTQPAPEA